MAKLRAKDDPDLTVAEWDARLADLRKRLAEAKAGLATISGQRRAIALKVTAGDEAATAELAALNLKAVELTSAEDMLGMGIEAAMQSRAVVVTQEAAAAEAARQKEITFLSRQLLGASQEADRLMRATAEVLERRRQFGLKLGRLGMRVPRLISGDSSARAAHHHGLAVLLNMERTASNSHNKPLAEADAPVLHLGGEAPAEDAA